MSSLLNRILYTSVGFVSLIIYTFLGFLKQEPEHQQLEEYEDRNKVKSCLLKLSNHVRIHYHRPSNNVCAPQLIVFVHGFPDSCHLWTRYLTSDLNLQAQMIALDLPGFGKSDGLPSYGPDAMLTTVHLAILELKKKYGSTHCIVIAYDWGGIITSHICAQTEGVINHLILVNSLFVPHFGHMINQRIEKAGQIISTGPKAGSYKSWLASIKKEVDPVAMQLYRSHYILVFQLQLFSAERFPLAMRSLLGVCRRWAAAESRHYLSQHGYSLGVAGRQQNTTPNHWHGRVSLYRDGLMTGPWISAPHALNGVILDDKTIKCTTTVMFGLDDQALDSRIVAEGIESFIQPLNGYSKGQVYMLEGVGHWSPLNARCHEVILKVLETNLWRKLKNGEYHQAMQTLCDVRGFTGMTLM